MPECSVVALQERDYEFRTLESFIGDCEHACPLLWRKTLSLSFKAVCYMNVSPGKGQLVPHLQDVQKQERSVGNYLPTVAMKVQSRDFRQCICLGFNHPPCVLPPFQPFSHMCVLWRKKK